MAVYTAIDDAGSFYNTKLYTGTGSSLAVTGVGFQPDFTWIKNRDTTDFHVLTDAVRGVTKYINSNNTNAEATDVESLTSFDSGGFTVGDMAEVNTNTEDYVSWNWKAGTTTGIAGSPSITPSSYSFNATSGQSIIAYTGTTTGGETIPHGLGVVPDMVIVKKLSTTSSWLVYHSALDATAPEDFSLSVDTTAARDDSVGGWHDTAPTSALVSLGVDNNSGSVTYIAYCFANVQGYSKMAGYTGNGTSTFVYTGFKPAYLLLKVSSAVNGWLILDSKRTTFNPMGAYNYANAATAEGTVSYIDFLSNGFRLVSTSSVAVNQASATYIYAAFAESPFVNAEGVPTNAR